MSNTGPEASEEKSFEIINMFSIKMYGAYTNAYRSKLDLTVKRSMSRYDHYFSNFCRPPVPGDLGKDSATRHSRFWRRRFLKVFTIYGHGSHLGKWTATILAIFHSPAPGRLQMKFEQHWPRGSRGEVIWNSQHFSPYKSIAKQTWPHHKKVKCQCTIIILAISVDLPSLII